MSGRCKPSTRKKISPLHPEGRKKRKIKNRKETPDQKNQEEEREQEDKEDGRSRLRTKRTGPCALIIKPTEVKSYTDIINEVKKEPTLQKVGLAVARVRKTLARDVLLILDSSGARNPREIDVINGGKSGLRSAVSPQPL